jgi:hypothetical protein
MKTPARVVTLCLLCMFAFQAMGASSSSPPPTTAPVVIHLRTPKYPPKTKRTLHTDQEIALARQNIKKYPPAKALADAIFKTADEWLAWKDDDLRFLLTTPDVPRSFAVSASGCPVCGAKITEKGGDYAWIMDPTKPFKLKCPVDGTVFPTNDYADYYRSGFKEKKGWDTKYVDDGWGWTNPKTGEKFWFVAYYNHWMWHKYLVPGLRALSEAYLLSGDQKYARKAAVMLERIAEVYPGMDIATQSRYGQMTHGEYQGKVVNHIWETGLTQSLADSYDDIFDGIDSDAELQKSTGKTGAQIRSFIEANILEDGIDAYFSGKIRGNFGMHQSCLVHLARVRQTGPTAKWFDGLMNQSSGQPSMLGLNFALYDLFYRDGFAGETSPGYNSLWVNKISAYGDLLQQAGLDVFGIPRIRRMYDAEIGQINAGKFTPDLGDAGSVWGGMEGISAETFQTAYRHFKDPRYAALLRQIGATGPNTFKTFDSLFHPPIEAANREGESAGSGDRSLTPAGPDGKVSKDRHDEHDDHFPSVAVQDGKLPPAKPRLFDGYGLAILNNPADTTSLSMYYGLKAGHGHFDRLGFELFANGQPIMPDLGYPDAMNDFNAGIYTWSKNTISHNTVVVDAHRQLGNEPGTVELFADSPSVRALDVEAKETYPQCSTYRRAVIMVDAGRNQSYFVDVFTVAGGHEHDYSLHGPPGDFQMIGGNWSKPAKGTLAGENVAVGEIYDDKRMGAKGYKGGYGSYTGSGFQYLTNVRKLEQASGGVTDSWVAQWKHEKDPHSMLRIRVLDQPGQTTYLCDARVSPMRYPQIVRYLIARRSGTNLASRFVSVIEPFKDKPFIKDVRQLKLNEPDAVALQVTREDGQADIILYNPSGHRIRIDHRDINTEAQVALTTFDAHGKLGRSFRAFSKVGPKQAIGGKVTQVLPLKSVVDVSIDPDRPLDPQSLIGQVVHFVNDHHRTAHTITSAWREGPKLELTLGDDLMVGLAKVDQVDKQMIRTSTPLPLAPTYRGASITDERCDHYFPIVSASDGRIKLASPLPRDATIKKGDLIWISDVAPGDSVEIPLLVFTK